MRNSWPLALLALALLAGPAVAQTSYPMITHVAPVAVQRGKTTVVTVAGQMNFAGTYKALFEGGGIRARVLPAKGKAPALVRAVRLELTVAPDAAPGVREFRLASSLGVSSVGQLVVTEHPVVEEKGDNNALARANPVPVPCVVAGRIEALEDVDYFKFKAKAGQTFTFEVHGARLQDKVHDLQKHVDPMLTLFDAEGRELAANDDFYFADPLLAHTFAADGDYYVQVRDSKYDGDPRWVYALLITDRPHATHVFPMAGNPGKTIAVEPVGSAGKGKGVTLKAPSEPGLHEVVLDLGGGKTTSPVPFLVSTLPQVMEVEPNDTPDQATRVAVPCGINGRIGAPRDLDHYVFKASKGKAIRVEVKARRFGTLYRSSLDSVIDVMTTKGAVLATNDDAFGKDSALVFVPPADGDYVLRIRDLNNKGGPTAIYYVEVDWARPDFAVRIDGDKAMIGPGSRTAWFVQVDRRNGFQGPVRIDVKGLPPGVAVNALTVPPTMTQGLLVLSADKAATRDAQNVEVTGTGKIAFGGEEKDEVRPATPIQEIYSPGGGRALFDVKMQTVAVTEPSDILDVQVSATEVVLRPGEEVRLEVTILRKAGHAKGVSLDVMLRHLGRVFGNALPPGVTLVEGKSKTLLGGGSKGHVVLRAAPTAAPIEKVPMAVLANVSINFVVKVHYASAPILVSVRK